MQPDDAILAQLNSLIELGNKVLASKYETSIMHPDSGVDEGLAFKWSTRVRNLLSSVFGCDSEHYKEFVRTLSDQEITYSPAYRALGILVAAYEDLEAGHIFRLRRLLEAEVFDDLLNQAEHLLEVGYKGPAAVAAGCVLEDGLRKLSEQEGIELSDSPKLDRMNAELARRGLYNKLVQKRITALADVRNNAAHGKWDLLERDDVEDMIAYTRRFLGDHLR